MSKRYCAQCGEEISSEKGYYKCLDNFLQIKYFENDSDELNCFCSQECFCEFTSLEWLDTDDEDYSGNL